MNKIPDWAKESNQWNKDNGYVTQAEDPAVPGYRFGHMLWKFDRQKIRCRIYTIGVDVDQNKVNTVQQWYASYGWDFFFEPTEEYLGPGKWVKKGTMHTLDPTEVAKHTKRGILPIIFINANDYEAKGHVGMWNYFGDKSFIIIKDYKTRIKSNGWADNDGFTGTLRHELSHMLPDICKVHDYTHHFDGTQKNDYRGAANLGNFIMTLPRGKFAENNHWPVPMLAQPNGM